MKRNLSLQKSMLSPQVPHDEQATRLATVNPNTGELIADSCDDATVLHVCENNSNLKKSAEFIPASLHRATGEVTAHWSADERDKRDQIIDLIRKKGRLFGLVFLGVFMLLITSLFLVNNNTISNTKIIKTKTASALAKPAQSSLPKTPLIKIPDGSICLKHAADALMEGRLNEAQAVYRQLESMFPQEPSYSVAIKILENNRSKK